MRITRQDPKVSLHMAMIAIALLGLFPIAILAVLLSVASAGAFLGPEPTPGNLTLAVVFLMPILLFAWGVRLLSSLRDGFSKSIRWKLFCLYFLLFSYSAGWAVVLFDSFGPGAIIIAIPVILFLLLIPPLVTLFTTASHDEA